MSPLPTPTPSSSAPWRGGLNALLLAAGIGGVAFALMAGNAPVASSSAVLAVAPAAPDVGAWLAGMPTGQMGTVTGMALEAAFTRVKAQPVQAAAWSGLGDVIAQCQRESNDASFYAVAEKCYQWALNLNPAWTDAMAGMGWVHGGRHEFDLSMLWAEKALSADAGHATAHGIIGDAAVELGDYDKAYEHYQKMLDLRPDLSSWSRGAHLLWLTGNQSKAVMLMGQAIRSGGPYAENTSWCRARLALMLFNNGALVPAAQALEPALAKGTTNFHVLLVAGRIAAAEGNFPEAEAHYRKVLEKGPNLEALIGLGDIATVQQRTEDAAQAYASVKSLHAQHRQTGVHDHMEMARFYADHGMEADEALRLAREHGEVRNVFEADTMAWVLFQHGDQAKAIEYIKQALKTNTPDPAIHYHAGCIAAAAGDRVSAQKHLQKALSMNPVFSVLHAPKAVALLEKLGSTAPVTPVVAERPGNSGNALSVLK